MSYVFQNRKNDKRYSIKKRHEWWVCIDPEAPGLSPERYRVGSKKEAEREIEEIEKKRIARKYGIVLSDETISDVLDNYLNSKSFSDYKHMANVIRYLKKPFTGVKYRDLTIPMYEEKRKKWKRIGKNHEGKDLAPVTIVNYEKIFRAGIRFHKPSDNIFKGKKVRFVNVSNKGFRDTPVVDEHLRAILYELERMRLDEEIEGKDYFLVRALEDFLRVLRYSGMRNGALRKLKKEKVLFGNINRIHVPSCRGKKSREYEIPIDGRISNILKGRMSSNSIIVNEVVKYLIESNVSTFCKLNDFEKNKMIQHSKELLFPEAVLFKWFYNEVSVIFKKIIRKLELPEYHLHDLRHAAATEWYLKSKNIKKVSLALGHTTVQTTQHYINRLMVNISSCYDLVRECDQSYQAEDPKVIPIHGA